MFFVLHCVLPFLKVYVVYPAVTGKDISKILVLHTIRDLTEFLTAFVWNTLKHCEGRMTVKEHSFYDFQDYNKKQVCADEKNVLLCFLLIFDWIKSQIYFVSVFHTWGSWIWLYSGYTTNLIHASWLRFSCMLKIWSNFPPLISWTGFLSINLWLFSSS